MRGRCKAVALEPLVCRVAVEAFAGPVTPPPYSWPAGMSFFGKNDNFEPYASFDTFGISLATLTRCATVDAWEVIMYIAREEQVGPGGVCVARTTATA